MSSYAEMHAKRAIGQRFASPEGRRTTVLQLSASGVGSAGQLDRGDFGFCAPYGGSVRPDVIDSFVGFNAPDDIRPRPKEAGLSVMKTRQVASCILHLCASQSSLVLCRPHCEAVGCGSDMVPRKHAVLISSPLPFSLRRSC
ncbi:hypothetical protein P3342_013515 [Pyrenophora teres f. teres]|nr:hypothetical protein P3342_013515 [Pyrenophora teres f. teres]